MKSYLNYLLSGLILFFAPIQGLLIAVAFGILLDTFTGIFKSVKLNGWCSIRSRRLSHIISKMLLYQTTILLLYVIDKFLLNEFVKLHFTIDFMFTKLVAILLIFIELVSIKENVEEALKIDIWKMLKNLLNRAKEVKDDIDEIK
jgi:Bacteriophage holin family